MYKDWHVYITGAVSTTLALQMIIGLTPLDVYIKQEAMFSCFWLQVNAQSTYLIGGAAGTVGYPLTMHRP